MRRKYFGLAIAAFATLGPMQAWGGDREIAEQIIQRLKTNRDSGVLKDFTLDMKVDQGVVIFRGDVSQESQRDLVLKAADGVNGVTKVVDAVKITTADGASVLEAETMVSRAPKIEVAQATPTQGNPDFSFREALATQANAIQTQPEVMPGEIRRTAAEEPARLPSDDQQVVTSVVAALGNAKDNGQLKGFGVDVRSQNGVLELTGRASSAAQRDTILRIAESVPGVAGVREAIAIPSQTPGLPALPTPPVLQDFGGESASLAPVAVDPVNHPLRNGTPAVVASAPLGVPSSMAQYRMQGGAQTAAQVGTGYPTAGQPVPMAPYGGGGAGPRYDTPNLPNYAWPGYAAYPNYAAVTYPQQYSPTAWPFIGPFYPYPQVPLGWRKVSLEWDDGWWFLDFTDR
jgi:osmotically-inducible protein OsmY